MWAGKLARVFLASQAWNRRRLRSEICGVRADILSTEATFRADGRLVEVYATVTDSRGRYVDDLTQDQFTIMEQGTPRAAAGFSRARLKFRWPCCSTPREACRLRCRR